MLRSHHRPRWRRPSRWLVATLVGSALVLPSGVLGAPVAASAGRAHDPQSSTARIIVGVADHAANGLASRATVPAAAGGLAARVDGTVAGPVGPGAFALDVPRARVADAMAALAARPGVAYVQPDHTVRAVVVPDDPCVTSCPFTLPPQWALGRINAPRAWDVTRGSSDVLVAVLDTGVSVGNPDLAGKIVAGPTFAPTAFDPPCGTSALVDHATYVAGVIGAATDNGIGIAGLGWNTRVLSIKVLDNYGCGRDDTLARGVYAAADTPGVRVINLSVQVSCDPPTTEPCPGPVLAAAIAYAQSKGVLVVAAAGNGDGHVGSASPTYPAVYAGVLAVAATDQFDHIADFSSYGPWVDLAAPGVAITSTYATTYATASGTSVAAPFVSATAALIFAAHPTMSADEVAARILAHADWIPGTGPRLAHGRLDAGGAVASPPRGYWEVSLDGGVFSFGDAAFHGSTGNIRLARPIVGMAATPSGNGYWLVASDGGIFAFGDAGFFGSTGGIRLAQPIVGMAATPSGNGYWLVAADGGIFAFGDAGFFGSTGAVALNRPIVGMAATPSGNGYWLVASDGGIFAFGDAGFFGSTGGIRLARPIVGMAATPSGDGYWLVASDGGIFAFGDAPFLGSTGGQPGVALIAKMAATATGEGYWLVGFDGSVYAFGDAPDLGRVPAPSTFVIGIANRP